MSDLAGGSRKADLISSSRSPSSTATRHTGALPSTRAHHRASAPGPSRASSGKLDGFARRELRQLDRLDSPCAIQSFLDEIDYSAEPVYRSPRSVLRDRKAHCFDGALFAAAALRRLGHPPLLLDLRATRDDDHVIAVYRRDRLLGAVAKSNFVGLRSREPIYRSLRELALSYFESYYNTEGLKSLRSYSTLLDLTRFDHVSWMTCDERLELIATALDRLRHYPLLSDRAVALLSPVDRRSYEAGMMGANAAGIYQPPARDEPAPGVGA